MRPTGAGGPWKPAGGPAQPLSGTSHSWEPTGRDWDLPSPSKVQGPGPEWGWEGEGILALSLPVLLLAKLETGGQREGVLAEVCPPPGLFSAWSTLGRGAGYLLSLKGRGGFPR